jgi:hypothetical protein
VVVADAFDLPGVYGALLPHSPDAAVLRVQILEYKCFYVLALVLVSGRFHDDLT